MHTKGLTKTFNEVLKIYIYCLTKLIPHAVIIVFNFLSRKSCNYLHFNITLVIVLYD